MKLSQILLVEAQNYESMFNDIPWAEIREDRIEDFQKFIGTQISLAKVKLKRNDRIIWYLRFVKIHMLNNLNFGREGRAHKFLTKLSQKWAQTPEQILEDWSDSYQLILLMRELTHSLSLPIPAIHATVFDWQSYDQLTGIFVHIEEEWKEQLESMIPFDPDTFKEIVIDFKDGWFWVDLGRGACSVEADAMGHCGNVPSVKNGDTILSLRKMVDAGTAGKYWEPHLTFILNGDGYLGEMKGRANDKPANRYHPYIIALLKNPVILGIRGGGYAPENNFSMDDLDENIKDKLFKLKPGLKGDPEMQLIFETHWTLENIEAVRNALNAHSRHTWSVDYTVGGGYTLYVNEEIDMYDALRSVNKNYTFLADIYNAGYVDDDDLEVLFEKLEIHDHHDAIITMLNNLYKNHPEKYDELTQKFSDGQMDLFGDAHVSPSRIIAAIDNDRSPMGDLLEQLFGHKYFFNKIKNLIDSLYGAFRCEFGYAYAAADSTRYWLAIDNTDFEYLLGDDGDTNYERAMNFLDHQISESPGYDSGFYLDGIELDFEWRENAGGDYHEMMKADDSVKILDAFYKSLLNPDIVV